MQNHHDIFKGYITSENCLRICKKCADSYHPAHAQGLIWAFSLIHSIEANNSGRGQRRPWSDCASAQSDSGLLCPRLPGRHIFAWLSPIMSKSNHNKGKKHKYCPIMVLICRSILINHLFYQTEVTLK